MFSWLPSKLAAAEQEAQRLGVRWVARLRTPATDSQIERAESELGLVLPDSQKQFFKISDGAFLGIVLPKYGEDDPFGVEIFSIADMVTRTAEYSAGYGRYDEENKPPFWRSLVAIGTWGGCGDLCLLDPEQPTSAHEYVVLDGFNEAPDLWRKNIIARSFADWVEQMFNALIVKGTTLEYWAAVPIRDLIDKAPPGPDRTLPNNASTI